MTITQLLENQNMASACKTTYTYSVESGNQEAGSAAAIAVNKLMLTTTETVCYQPIIGYTFLVSFIVIFIYSAYLIYCWLNPNHKK